MSSGPSLSVGLAGRAGAGRGREFPGLRFVPEKDLPATAEVTGDELASEAAGPALGLGVGAGTGVCVCEAQGREVVIGGKISISPFFLFLHSGG